MSAPWDRLQHARGLRGWLYRWLYGEKRRQAIREELRKRR